ncbi:hypothetical protein DMX02_12920 [Pseudomonas jessenii]|nr:hypothetical protein DMX02_12920 [Pseudomonas jessenii]
MSFFRYISAASEAVFASKLAPTLGMRIPVGASLLAKRPAFTPQISLLTDWRASRTTRNK